MRGPLALLALLAAGMAAPEDPQGALGTGDNTGSGQCGRGGVRIAARWDIAIASYDPMARSMWLEFDLEDANSRESLRQECLAANHGSGYEARVILDDELVARTQDAEAGLVLENIDLGRHWLTVRLVDSEERYAFVHSIYHACVRSCICAYKRLCLRVGAPSHAAHARTCII